MPEIGEIRKGHELGYKSPNLHIYQACVDCGKARWVPLRKGKPVHTRCRDCSRKDTIFRAKMSDAHRGDKSYRWQGGRIKIENGYILVHLYPGDPFYEMASKKGYVLEHRLVMAQHLGRPLADWEKVHHKDGTRDHNDWENLVLTTAQEHALETRNSVKEAYNRGFQDGLKVRDDDLKREIRLLRWQINELIGEHRLI